ncbi:MAG: bifunctional 4-hydroxy-2-oxoglutarate aldolase/2-dehydro-3-deoxy-phosphogluconate aldolase [Bacteroidales bacterium]|jgi:2-dehydro-3-deoxyphosphogluconate aldolase/(4S)-4-hydroxy-2-oxoglutarate aldolase
MAQFYKAEVVLAMKDQGMVPVFYHHDPITCMNVLKACYEGGLRIFEFTNRGNFAHETFGELEKYTEKELPDMILGAGSVVDSSTATLYIQLGANFIVSPVLDIETAKICNRRGIAWCPGCGSATEIVQASESGADVVKLFPAKEVGGPSFIKNIKGPVPWLNIMPTGGVEPTYENLFQWFKAGAWCVGMGSKLFPMDDINAGNFDLLKEKVKDTLALIQKIRKDLA